MHDIITAILGILVGLCLGIAWATFALQKAYHLVRKGKLRDWAFVDMDELKKDYFLISRAEFEEWERQAGDE